MNEMKLRKTLTYGVFGLVATAAVLMVADMWFHILTWSNLGRLLATLVVAAGLLGTFLLIRNDLRDEEKLKKDKYID